MTPAPSLAEPPRFLASALMGLAQVVIWGGSFFLLTVLADPIHRDTGWSLTWIYGALTVGVMISGLLSPRASAYIARGQGRHLLVVSGWIVSAGLLMLAAAPNFAVFVIGWAVIGVGMAGGLYDPLFATLGTQYGQRARPAIQSVTLIGGFATTLTWPVLAWMNDAIGWRYTCVAYAIFLALTIGPMYGKALPADVADKADLAEKARAGSTAVPAKASAASGLSSVDPKLFALLSLVFSIAAILMTAVSVQIVVLLQGTGHSTASAIALSALIGPSMVAVRGLSLALKNLHAIWLTLFSTVFVALGLLAVSSVPAAAALGLVFYGIGNGLRALVRGTLPLALVPASAYAEVMGRLARSSLFCQALTPLACGFVLTQWGAGATLWLLAVLAVANVMLCLALRRMVRRLQATTAPA